MKKTIEGIELWDVAEVCKVMGVSLPYLYRSLNSGRLPSTKIGPKYWIQASTIEKWAKGEISVTMSDKTSVSK